MEFDWVEWFGYLASLVVLVSLTMTSIVKLRVINFIGCLLFAAFAYFIDSYPTMFMNLGIAGINVYYLYHLYHYKEKFKLISASTASEYFQHFTSTNKVEIDDQIPVNELRSFNTAFYMLRNNTVAGVLVGNIDESGELEVALDFVTPEYRDMKVARFFYSKHPEHLVERGVKEIVAVAPSEVHAEYLEQVGFTKESGDEQKYRMSLVA
ncbi:hypothetical protein [Vibrio mexicanus]|uniref:hypothetical protein n=1 Tax=Vibrio mexicanus TaxID=1004326 RepID=UPI00063C7161|nr:hypothetical protein [Vibrio mexicanus]